MNDKRIPETIFECAFFYDTSAFTALLVNEDKFHESAKNCENDLRELKFPLYTTSFTIAETYRQLNNLKRFDSEKKLRFLDIVYSDFNIIRPTEKDEESAISLIKKFKSYNLSLTDAISLIIMERQGITYSFSFDGHFSIIGFIKVPPLPEEILQFTK